jgi:glycosyltransferase involved in cell wall biosynthesis
VGVAEMKFLFLSAATFEPWDWTNPDTQGIGGSETSHIEMAQRLSKLGHEVLSYAPTPFAEKVDPYGVTWRNCIPFHEVMEERGTIHLGDWVPDVWVVYRWPSIIPSIPKEAKIWLICQDTDYKMEGNILTEEICDRIHRVVALCETHREYLSWAHPTVKDRIVVSSNGIKTELIEEIAKERLPRNPHRLIYPSSPDRGLEFLLHVFPRAKEIVPDLELHVYYGFDNIQKMASLDGPAGVGSRGKIAMLGKLLDQPGVINHGRMPQPLLIREWFQSGIWCHPSNFTETSCITSMDAQACGAVPITNPLWAVRDNVRFGTFIEGNLQSDLIRSRYVSQLIDLALQPGKQEEIRREMMPWARDFFRWDKWVFQWEGWAEQDCLEAAAA